MLKWLRGDPKPASAPAATLGAIEIRRPWARRSSETPGQGGGFFVVTNTGADADRLVAASSPAAETVEIHAIKVVGGDITIRLPNPHKGDVGIELLARILRQAGINRDEWEAL